MDQNRTEQQVLVDLSPASPQTIDIPLTNTELLELGIAIPPDNAQPTATTTAVISTDATTTAVITTGATTTAETTTATTAAQLPSAVETTPCKSFDASTLNNYVEKLKSLLQNSSEGKSLLKLSESNTELSDHFRIALVDCIISQEIKDRLKYKIPSAVLKAYSLAIPKVFTHEKSSVYYVDYVYLGKGKKKVQGANLWTNITTKELAFEN